MRRIIWTMGMSVDGFMEGPNREIDWHMVDEEYHQHMNDWLGQAGAFLEGRLTYELMAAFWPTADQEEGAPPFIVEFAQIWRDMPKLVYSRTLERADWNSTIVRDVVANDVAILKEQPGGDLVLGGAVLGSEFARLDLIDEYRVYIHPILIGRGRPMMQPFDGKIPLRLADTQTFGNGVQLLRYERAPAPE